jgi:hypothetical protein
LTSDKGDDGVSESSLTMEGSQVFENFSFQWSTVGVVLNPFVFQCVFSADSVLWVAHEHFLDEIFSIFGDIAPFFIYKKSQKFEKWPKFTVEDQVTLFDAFDNFFIIISIEWRIPA